jgi:chromate transporter
MEILIELFCSFVVIGLGAYGGGLVTIPLIQHELVANRNWLLFSEMAEILAIAQITPGPIGINAATFAGFRVHGVIGAAAATLAVILPSMIILTLILPFIDRFSKNYHFRRLRKGLQLGVLSLILFAVWSYGVMAIEGWLDLGIALAAFVLLVAFEKKLHPVIVILAGGVVGILLF